jgi:hypothetical protein
MSPLTHSQFAPPLHSVMVPLSPSEFPQMLLSPSMVLTQKNEAFSTTD